MHISVYMLFISGSPMGVILPPRGHFAISGEIFGCPNWEGILASSGYRPRMLLNILWYKVQSPTTKNYLYINKNKCSKYQQNNNINNNLHGLHNAGITHSLLKLRCSYTVSTWTVQIRLQQMWQAYNQDSKFFVTVEKPHAEWRNKDLNIEKTDK